MRWDAVLESVCDGLRRAAKTRPLKVVDPAGKFLEFLREEKIHHQELGALPANLRGPIILVDPDVRDLPRIAARTGNTVVFREFTRNLPKVVVQCNASGKHVDVQMEFIDSLSVNPLHQLLLLEVLTVAGIGESDE